MTSAGGDFYQLEIRPRLVAPDATAIPVFSTLVYRSDDPVAVEITFDPDADAGELVTWTFSRELLARGLDAPAGVGDVRVWPWATPRGDFVALALSSPDGNALFELPRETVVRFLQRSYHLVSRKQEAAYCYFGALPVVGAPVLSPTAEALTRIASVLAGPRRDYRETWLADLRGDPERGYTLTAHRQIRMACGFILAAARLRGRDLVRLARTLLERFLGSERRALTSATIVTLAAGGHLWAAGSLVRVWENGENLAAIGGLIWGLGAVVRRLRVARRGNDR